MFRLPLDEEAGDSRVEEVNDTSSVPKVDVIATFAPPATPMSPSVFRRSSVTRGTQSANEWSVFIFWIFFFIYECLVFRRHRNHC